MRDKYLILARKFTYFIVAVAILFNGGTGRDNLPAQPGAPATPVQEETDIELNQTNNPAEDVTTLPAPVSEKGQAEEERGTGFKNDLAATGFPVDPNKEAPAATTPQPVPERTTEPARPVTGSAFATADRSTIEPYPRVPPYTLGPGRLRQLCVQIRVTNTGAEEARNIRVEVPLLAELDSPYQAIAGEAFNPSPVHITADHAQNRLAHFVIGTLSPGGSETITLHYTLQVYPFTANFAAYRESPAPAGTGYLRPSPKIESSHPEIVLRAREITAGAENELEKAEAIFDFVRSHIIYDARSPYRNSGALSALRHRTGVCEEYATLFVALCRAVGIPARQVNGYADPGGTGERWESAGEGSSLPLLNFRHSWAEFYLAGMGWLPADPTMNLNGGSPTLFGSLANPSHLVQNYHDRPLRIHYRSGKLTASWREELVN